MLSALRIDAHDLIIPTSAASIAEADELNSVVLPSLAGLDRRDNLSPALPAAEYPGETLPTEQLAAVDNSSAPIAADPYVSRSPREVEEAAAHLPEDGKWYVVTQGRRPGVYPNMYDTCCVNSTH